MSINICGVGSASNENLTITTTFLSLKDSYLLLVTDQDQFGIGTVTLSIPPTGLGTVGSSSPFSMFGMKNSLLANLIGKNASKKLKKPVLSLIFIKENQIKPNIIMKITMEAVSLAIEAVNKNMDTENT
jgi:hypothetical protein